MTTFEYPLSEKTRTYLRAEELLQRLHDLMVRDDAVSHHAAIQVLFDLQEMANRSDIKGDLIKDLERQRMALSGFKGNPAISEAVLAALLQHIEKSHTALAQSTGKPGQALSESEWLNAIRGRIGIPAGTCSFDMPAYHRWRQLPAAHRRVHLEAWAAHFKPMSDALRLLLGMLRDNAETVSVVAVGGQFQQPLPQGRSYQLLRIELPQDRDDAVPEISANRLLVNVRWALLQDDLRCVADGRDIHFTLSLCN